MDSQEKFYEGLKRLFLFDPDMPTLQQFAKSKGIGDVDKFVQYATRNDWEFDRKTYRETVDEKLQIHMAQFEAAEIGQQLSEIQALKTRAFIQANSKVFRDSGQAIGSYLDLAKYEALLLRNPSASIAQQELDLYMLGVVNIIFKHIPKSVARDNMMAELSGFTIEDAKKV
jgi:hypothetical protein